MTLEQLAKEIYSVSHLTGSFRLRSGKTSSEYFDKYRFESQPRLLKEITSHLAGLLPTDIDALAGLEMGGIPIATALSLHTGLPLVFVRKKAKDYGTCLFAEGIEIKGKKLCLVEDVITTGGQVVLSAKDLRDSGALVKNVICVIYRGEGAEEALAHAELNLRSLLTKEQLHAASKT